MLLCVMGSSLGPSWNWTIDEFSWPDIRVVVGHGGVLWGQKDLVRVSVPVTFVRISACSLA